MTERDRVRRAIVLCFHFARNHAYYVSGWSPDVKILLTPDHLAVNFWRTTNSNSLDILALEWCKLFADKKAKHYWRKVVSDPDGFEKEYLKIFGDSQDELSAYIDTMKIYRDKFVAHLDELEIMQIPHLEKAFAAVKCLHGWLTSNQDTQKHIMNICANSPESFEVGYNLCLDEARAVLLFNLTRAVI